MSKQPHSSVDKVRLDKWLWAARFYKTRSIAKQAIEGGKVRCQGARAKAAKEISIGLEINLRQGFDEKTVIVRALSEQRRSASQAQSLYEETSASIEQRQAQALQRKNQAIHLHTEGKPNKRERRQIHKFKQDS